MTAEAVAAYRVTPALGDAERAIIAEALVLLERACRRGPLLQSPREVGQYLALHLACRDCEHFVALMLDSQHRLIETVELARGTLDGAAVYPREVVKAALAYNAAAVIFSHNHPSGEPEPSAADRALTDRLREALKLVDIRTLDHVVVGGARWVSLAERGWV